MTTAVASPVKPLGIETWLRSAGIWWDENLVRIQGGCSGCSGPALGVFAQTDIHENQLLCVIPRSAILSPRTTKLAHILETEKLGGGLALTIAVMYEASLGADSKWAGYFASLPKREYLPMFWTDDELLLLQGTALEGCAADDRRDTEEDYQTHVIPLMTRHKEAFPHPELCSLCHFRVAASWVASRSFHVDSWHGDAMVPLADIFNHKASLVLLDDSWKVAEEMYHAIEEVLGHHSSKPKNLGLGKIGAESDDQASTEGQEEGGSGSEAESQDGTGSDHDQDDPQHGFALGGMPMIAAGAAAAAASGGGIVHKAASSWVRDEVNLRLEIGICSLGPPDNTDLAAAAAAAAHDLDHDDPDHGPDEDRDRDHCGADCSHRHKRQRTQQQPDPQQQQQQEGEASDPQRPNPQQQQQQQLPEKRLEIIAASPIAAGSEVHNTYGELSNAELVHKYGFCLPQNPFDEVRLGPSWSWLLLEVGGLGSNKELKQNIQWLQRHSDVLADQQQDSDDEDEQTEVEASASDPPAVTPGGRLLLPAAAVLRVLGATPAQLDEWDSLGDVLQDVLQSQEVTTAVTTAEDSGVADIDPSAAETALSQQFEDVLITSRDVLWWGRAGLEVLAAGIEQRLMQYKASVGMHTSSRAKEHKNPQAELQQQGKLTQSIIEADEKALKEIQAQQLRAVETSSNGEHVAAVSAALQFRICEQRILKQALDAVQHVLDEARR